MIFNEQDTQLARERGQTDVAVSKPTGFWQNAKSAFTEFQNNDSAGALRSQRIDAYDQRIKQAEGLTGETLENPWNQTPAPFRSFRDSIDPEKLSGFDKLWYDYTPSVRDPIGMIYSLFERNNGLTEPQRLRKHEDEIDRIRQSLPQERRHLLPSRAQIEEQLKAQAKRLERENKDIAGRSTVAGMVGQLAGAGGASLSQPEVLITLPIGASARAGLLSKILIEAGVAATTEAALQPGVQAQRAELGLESGVNQALLNVGVAGAGAAGLTAALSPVAMAFQLVRTGGVSAFERVVGREATPDEAALIHAVRQDGDVARASPYEERTAAAERVQAENEALAFDPVLRGELPEEDAFSDAGMVRRATQEGTSLQLLTNDELKDVGVDADLMQFKSGGDAEGVTDRLRGVETWEIERAGVSLIYEMEDGTRIIADGHQRLGLAKRLAARGQEIEFPALILREIDGISPAEARARAAFKNISEGTGSASDAAKVLRDMGVDPREIGLPPKSALVRDAEGLSNLNDEVFGMVINEVISEQQGAIIGRLIQDPAFQTGVARLINRLQPANATQAESIVRQAAEAGVSRETQSSLFGDEEVAESLFLERAKVLDRAMKMVRRNIDTFRTLSERGTDIASEGNVLNESGNVTRLQNERTVRQFIEAQAHRKGFISDELETAARKAKETGQIAPAAREFLAAITRGAREGKIDGPAIPSRGPDQELEQPRQEAQGTDAGGGFEPVDDATLNMFDEPAGPAAQDQAINIANELADGADDELLGLELPTGERIDANGERVTTTQTVQETLDELEADQEFVEQLKLCDGKAAA